MQVSKIDDPELDERTAIFETRARTPTVWVPGGSCVHADFRNGERCSWDGVGYPICWNESREFATYSLSVRDNRR